MATKLKPGIQVPVQHSAKETVLGTVYKVEPKGHILVAYTAKDGVSHVWADPHPDNPALWVPVPPAPEASEDGEDEEEDYIFEVESSADMKTEARSGSK